METLKACSWNSFASGRTRNAKMWRMAGLSLPQPARMTLGSACHCAKASGELPRYALVPYRANRETLSGYFAA